ncbi:MAG: hypothetical protein IKH13_03240 [Clostridia bacterium]|nr:hypothetical protein [Clostridia bacterium]
MSKNKFGIESKDITTMAVAAIALALVVFVFIRMYIGNSRPAESEADRTTIVEYSRINDEGEIEFYTMIENYTDSGMHASVRYPTTSTTEESTEETETEEDETMIVFVTDELGEYVTDENGEAITKIETTVKPETKVVPVTDESGEKVTDEKGKPVTQTVTVPPTESTTETTTKDVWTEATATSKMKIPGNYTNETGTANTIISEINRERAENGLEPLAQDSGLSTTARAYSVAKTVGTSTPTRVSYYVKTPAGGSLIYKSVVASTDATTGDHTSIGVGVVKYNGEYYTTVILV